MSFIHGVSFSGNCDALQFVQSMELDPKTKWMWIIDTGRLNVFTEPVNKCPAKLVIWDTANDKMVKTKVFFQDKSWNLASRFESMSFLTKFWVMKSTLSMTSLLIQKMGNGPTCQMSGQDQLQEMRAESLSMTLSKTYSDVCNAVHQQNIFVSEIMSRGDWKIQQ